MRAGLLRHSASFQKSTETQDTTGAPIETWSEQFTRRFRISNTTGREFLSAQQATATMTHLFVFRYIDVAAAELTKMHLIYNSRRFEILAAIDQFGRHRETYLSVKELV